MHTSYADLNTETTEKKHEEHGGKITMLPALRVFLRVLRGNHLVFSQVLLVYTIGLALYQTLI